MIESFLVKMSKENRNVMDDFPFFDDLVPRGIGTDLQEIMGQILGVGDLEGKKIGFIKEGKDRYVDSANGLNGGDPGGSNLPYQVEFLKRS
jgi:hypothetical protein